MAYENERCNIFKRDEVLIHDINIARIAGAAQTFSQASMGCPVDQEDTAEMIERLPVHWRLRRLS